MEGIASRIRRVASKPLRRGHTYVHDDYGGTKFFRQLHCAASVFRFTNDLDIEFALQQPPNSFPDDLVIFRQQDSDSFHGHQDLALHLDQLMHRLNARTRPRLACFCRGACYRCDDAPPDVS